MKSRVGLEMGAKDEGSLLWREASSERVNIHRIEILRMKRGPRSLEEGEACMSRAMLRRREVLCEVEQEMDQESYRIDRRLLARRRCEERAKVIDKFVPDLNEIVSVQEVSDGNRKRNGHFRVEVR